MTEELDVTRLDVIDGADVSDGDVIGESDNITSLNQFSSLGPELDSDQINLVSVEDGSGVNNARNVLIQNIISFVLNQQIDFNYFSSILQLTLLPHI